MTSSSEPVAGPEPKVKGLQKLKMTVVGPLTIGLVLILVFGLMLIVNIRTGEAGLQRALQASSQPLVSTAARLLFNPLYTLDIGTLDDMLDRFLGPHVVYVGVRDLNGHVVAEAGERWTADEQTSMALAAQALAQGDIVRYEVDDYLILTSPIAVGSEQIGTVEFAFATASMRATLGATQRTLSIAILIALVGTILIIAVIAQIVTQPLGELAVVAQEIGRGNLDTPVRIRGTAEMATLALALRQMRDQLRGIYAGLEQQVAERTRDLARRTAQLEATAEIGRAASSILDIDELIRRVVELIRAQFDLYYVGLFLVDDAGEWAVLQAGTGEAGRRMLDRGHRIRIGTGMVGWSVAHGQPRVALTAEEDAVRLATPELPDTRSEAALPLRSRGRVLGALTVQHTEPGAFDESVMTVLQIMADQVAVALDNARLYTESQRLLTAERHTYGEISRQAWQEMLRTYREWGYRYAQHQVSPTAGEWPPDMVQAIRTGQVVHGEDGRRGVLSIPIQVRGQAVGVLSFRKEDERWTEQEINLVRAFATRLEAALESARLYHEAQRRAAQDRLIGEVTARIRETLNMDVVLRTAIREMGEALGIPRVEVRMATSTIRPGGKGAAQGDAGPTENRASQENQDVDPD